MIWILRIPRSGPGKLIILVGYSSLLPKIDESRRPLRVSTEIYPVPQEVRILITSTSTNTVAVVYHRFKPFTKVQIYHAPQVSNSRHFLVYIPNYKDLNWLVKMIILVRVGTPLRFFFEN